ncbi:MAG: GxxExxY protein [Candidatus Moranbacteria bacterium]|nr:GxxExxY protein [Candidatus Moranbacteria bacterium]
MKYQNITHQIIGCCMKVHNELGPGFQEIIYQRALYLEFLNSQLDFVREKEIGINYLSKEIGTRRVDFLIEDRVLLEIKALSCLEDLHLAQAKNYLEASGLEVGLLVNFGGLKLEVKRLFGG